jgi:hypothetical protein
MLSNDHKFFIDKINNEKFNDSYPKKLLKIEYLFIYSMNILLFEFCIKFYCHDILT